MKSPLVSRHVDESGGTRIKYNQILNPNILI